MPTGRAAFGAVEVEHLQVCVPSLKLRAWVMHRHWLLRAVLQVLHHNKDVSHLLILTALQNASMPCLQGDRGLQRTS